jgi:NACalpha-BTF3-like transcription factor
MDQIEATRVIIEGPEKTLVIEQPEVVLMKQAGQEIYQVIGEADEYAADEFSVEEKIDIEETDQVEQLDVKPTITENDVMLVASQGNVDPEEARALLMECNGDIAKAIILIKNRP